MHHENDLEALPKRAKPEITTSSLQPLAGKGLTWKTKGNGPWGPSELLMDDLRAINIHEIHLQHLTMSIGIQMVTCQTIKIHRHLWNTA